MRSGSLIFILKDIRQAVLDEARAEEVDFVTCIRKGVFTVPGDGCINFAPIFEELLAQGYTGWAMLEGEQIRLHTTLTNTRSKHFTI